MASALYEFVMNPVFIIIGGAFVYVAFFMALLGWYDMNRRNMR